MNKSLNFEIIKGSNLEKFYGYLLNDEKVFYNEDYNKIIFIDCRKVIEYAIKEVIFSKEGMMAYENANIKSLKENINEIKEFMPKSLVVKLEYIRFAGNKYAHDLECEFNVLNSLKYTYDFIVWYLKNIEKKIDLNYDIEFIIPIRNNDEIKEKSIEYNWNEQELKKEILEMKEKLNESKKEKNKEIETLELEVLKYKNKIKEFEEESKKETSPIVEILEEVIESNKDLFNEEVNLDIIVRRDIVVNDIRENISILRGFINNLEMAKGMFSIDNVELIEDEYNYFIDKFLGLKGEGLKGIYGVFNKLRNDKKRLVDDDAKIEIYRHCIKEMDIEDEKIENKNKFKGNLLEFINRVHRKHRLNEGGCYIIDILNLYMINISKILEEKIEKTNNIKNVVVFSKAINEFSREDNIILINAFKNYYNTENFNLTNLLEIDLNIFSELMIKSKDLTEYITLNKVLLLLLEKLGEKREKVILNALERTDIKEGKEILFLIGAILLDKNEIQEKNRDNEIERLIEYYGESKNKKSFFKKLLDKIKK